MIAGLETPDTGEIIIDGKVVNNISPSKRGIGFVFQNYASKDSWSLSILAHGESSWQNAREGYGPDDRCTVPMNLDDIRNDAERIKMRRSYFDEILPQIKKNN